MHFSIRQRVHAIPRDEEEGMKEEGRKGAGTTGAAGRVQHKGTDAQHEGHGAGYRNTHRVHDHYQIHQS